MIEPKGPKEELKLCTTCKKVKKKSEFYVNKGKWDSLTRECSACLKKRMKVYNSKKR